MVIVLVLHTNYLLLPTTSTNLISLIGSSPSQYLKECVVQHLIRGRGLDARFLLPVLPALSKDDALGLLATLFAGADVPGEQRITREVVVRLVEPPSKSAL